MTGLSKLLCIVVLVVGCGDPVQRHIDTIIEGGEEADRAKLALNMAKADAVGPVIRAFEDTSLSVRARLDMADALYRLYLREDVPAIFASLVAALEDPVPEIRIGAAWAVGNLGKRVAVDPLLTRFSAESDPRMMLAILSALEFMSLGTNFNSQITPHLFSEEQKTSFGAALVGTRSTPQPDSLLKATVEW